MGNRERFWGTNFEDHLDQELKDPDNAAGFLAAALAEDDEKFLRQALNLVLKAHGMSKVASQTGIARQAIYKMLSSEGNPSFKNVMLLLETVGMELTVKRKKKAKRKKRAC